MVQIERTEMIYLNQPEAGKLVAWINRHADGSDSPTTFHHGMKVRASVKYVITESFRERPWG